MNNTYELYENLTIKSFLLVRREVKRNVQYYNLDIEVVKVMMSN